MRGSVKRVAVVGAGAVGSYYGAKLARVGVDVTFLLRSDYRHVAEHGMQITSVAGDFRLAEVKCETSTEAIGPVDLVIIAWKTTSNRHYREVLAPLVGEDTRILTLQNGLGSAEQLARLFGAGRVFGGLCFVCINRLGPGRIDHSASGMIRLGKHLEKQRELTEPEAAGLRELADCLASAGIQCEPVESLERAQWMKLVWNIPFNGLAIAEGGVDTRALLATDGMERRVRAVMLEVRAVAAAIGHDIPRAFIENQIEVTRPMQAYRPSSMIDYVEGREVEVDSIWREPLRRAKLHGVPTPEIERLLAGIEERLRQRRANE